MHILIPRFGSLSDHLFRKSCCSSQAFYWCLIPALRMKTKDQTEGQKGAWGKGQDIESDRGVCECEGLSLSRQWALSNRSSLRQPPATPQQPERPSLHSCDHPSAVPFKVWIRCVTSPLSRPSVPFPNWSQTSRTGQPSGGVPRHTSAAWLTGPGFVLWGFGGVKGSAYRHLLLRQGLPRCWCREKSLVSAPVPAWTCRPQDSHLWWKCFEMKFIWNRDNKLYLIFFLYQTDICVNTSVYLRDNLRQHPFVLERLK